MPLSGALVKVYRSDPVPDDKRMPTSYENESIHWNGYLKIDTAGVYNFSVATISPVYITLTLNSQVIMENEYSYANNNEYLDQNHLITLPVGIIPLEFKIRTDFFGGDIWKNFGLLYARPGDTLPRAIPATALFRDVSASLPGITGTYYSNTTFTPPAVLVRVDSTLVFSDYVIDNTPEFTMTTNLFGMANPGQNASLLANPSNKLNQRAHMAMARVEYEGQEFFKVIDITNLNQSFWRNPISPEPILLNVNPDGTHSLLPFDGHAPELPYKVYIPIALKQ